MCNDACFIGVLAEIPNKRLGVRQKIVVVTPEIWQCLPLLYLPLGLCLPLSGLDNINKGGKTSKFWFSVFLFWVARRTRVNGKFGFSVHLIDFNSLQLL